MLEAFCHVRSCRWVNPSHMIHTWSTHDYPLNSVVCTLMFIISFWTDPILVSSYLLSHHSTPVLTFTITTFSYAFSIMKNMLFAGYLRYMYYVYVVLPLIHLNYYFIKCNEQWSSKQVRSRRSTYKISEIYTLQWFPIHMLLWFHIQWIYGLNIQGKEILCRSCLYWQFMQWYPQQGFWPMSGASYLALLSFNVCRWSKIIQICLIMTNYYYPIYLVLQVVFHLLWNLVKQGKL